MAIGIVAIGIVAIGIVAIGNRSYTNEVRLRGLNVGAIHELPLRLGAICCVAQSGDDLICHC